MIISASRRTDIPAYYSEWFFERLREGGTIVRNPFNPKQERYIDLSHGAVDGLVFWSKDPAPMLARLRDLDGYPYYFLFTLNAYGAEIEPARPHGARLETFKRLSSALGPKRVIWRYDPILLSEKYTEKWHTESFAALAAALSGHTLRVTISFLDVYRNIAKRMKIYGIAAPGDEQIHSMAPDLARIARAAGMEICACAEPADLTAYGIARGRCVDAGLLGEITRDAGIGSAVNGGIGGAANGGIGGAVNAGAANGGIGGAVNAGTTTAFPPTGRNPRKDPNQRPECGCASSVDIGTYGTCKCGCIYCYARYMR